MFVLVHMRSGRVYPVCWTGPFENGKADHKTRVAGCLQTVRSQMEEEKVLGKNQRLHVVADLGSTFVAAGKDADLMDPIKTTIEHAPALSVDWLGAVWHVPRAVPPPPTAPRPTARPRAPRHHRRSTVSCFAISKAAS